MKSKSIILQAPVSQARTMLNNTVNTDKMKSLELGTKIEVEEISLQCDFKCTGQELFNALTQPEMIQIFTQNPIKMEGEAQKGTEFTLLGGNIQGSYVEVTPYTKIIEKWRLKSWPAGHFSTVTLTIAQTKEDTKLYLSQTSVPKIEVETTKVGWQRYYFHAIKSAFGFGASLF